MTDDPSVLYEMLESFNNRESNAYGPWNVLWSDTLKSVILAYDSLPIACWSRGGGRSILLLPESPTTKLAQLKNFKSSFNYYLEDVPGHNFDTCSIDHCGHVAMLASVGPDTEIERTIMEIFAEDGEEW